MVLTVTRPETKIIFMPVEDLANLSKCQCMFEGNKKSGGKKNLCTINLWFGLVFKSITYWPLS